MSRRRRKTGTSVWISEESALKIQALMRALGVRFKAAVVERAIDSEVTLQRQNRAFRARYDEAVRDLEDPSK